MTPQSTGSFPALPRQHHKQVCSCCRDLINLPGAVVWTVSGVVWIFGSLWWSPMSRGTTHGVIMVRGLRACGWHLVNPAGPGVGQRIYSADETIAPPPAL